MLVHFFSGWSTGNPKIARHSLGAMSKLVVPSTDQPLPFSNDVSIVRPSTVEASINIADALSTNGLHCLIPVIARTTLASRYRIVMSLPGLPCYRTCRVPHKNISGRRPDTKRKHSVETARRIISILQSAHKFGRYVMKYRYNQ